MWIPIKNVFSCLLDSVGFDVSALQGFSEQRVAAMPHKIKIVFFSSVETRLVL